MSTPYKILVVDDDQRNLSILRDKLESDGYEPIAAEDGESALFAFEQHRPDMVLLDIMMPGVDGREICQTLKERSGDVFIPIVLVTALTSSESKAEGFAAGADDYITKPVDFLELSARIRNLQKLQKLAHHNEARSISAPTYREGRSPIDEVFKVLADGLGSGVRTMYRVHSEGKKGYIGVEGHRFIHARAEGVTGRDALEKMLLWPAAEFEAVTFKRMKANLEVEFEEVLLWWVEHLDIWRLVAEKLPPRDTRLVANHARADELAGRGIDRRKVLDLFGSPRTLDDALRSSDLDVINTLRVIGELYYRGLLLREGEPSAEAVSTGAPLLGIGEIVPIMTPSLRVSDPVRADVGSVESEKRMLALEEELLSLRASNDALRGENLELRSHADRRLDRRVGELEELLEEARAGASAANDRVTGALHQKEAALANAEAEIAKLRDQSREVKGAADAYQTRIGMLQESINELNTQVMRANTNNSRLADTIRTLERDREELRREAEALRGDAAGRGATKPAEDAPLRRMLEAKDKEIQNLAAQVISANARVESQVVRLQDLEKKLSGAAEDKPVPQSAPNVLAELAELQGVLIEHENQIDMLRHQLRRSEDEKAALAARVDGRSADEIEQLRVELFAKREEIAGLRERLDLKHVRIDPATGLAKPYEDTPEINALLAQIKDRDQEIERLRGQLVGAARAAEDQNQLVVELNRLLDEQKREFERLGRK